MASEGYVFVIPSLSSASYLCNTSCDPVIWFLSVCVLITRNSKAFLFGLAFPCCHIDGRVRLRTDVQAVHFNVNIMNVKKSPLFPLTLLQSQLSQGPAAWTDHGSLELNISPQSYFSSQVPNVIVDQQHGTGPLRERERSWAVQQQATQTPEAQDPRLSISPRHSEVTSDALYMCGYERPWPCALPIPASPKTIGPGDRKSFL